MFKIITGSNVTFSDAQSETLAYLRGEKAGVPLPENDTTFEYPKLKAAAEASVKALKETVTPATVLESGLAYAVYRDAVYGSWHGRGCRMNANDSKLAANARARLVRKLSGASA